MCTIAPSIGLAIIVAKGKKTTASLLKFICKHETIYRKDACHNENSKDSKSIYTYKLSVDFIKTIN